MAEEKSKFEKFWGFPPGKMILGVVLVIVIIIFVLRFNLIPKTVELFGITFESSASTSPPSAMIDTSSSTPSQSVTAFSSATATSKPIQTSTLGAEIPQNYKIIDEFDGEGPPDHNIWYWYDDGDPVDCPVEQINSALTIACEPTNGTVLWGISPRAQMYKDAKGIAIAANVLTPSLDRWAKLQILLKFLDSDEKVILTYNIILRGSILHVEQEDPVNNYAKVQIAEKEIPYGEIQIIRIERVNNSLIFFLNSSPLATYDLALPSSVTQQSWAIEGRVALDEGEGNPRILEAFIYWAAYGPD